MIGTLRAAHERWRLWRWRYHHHDNLALRRLYRDRYGIEIGMYSYGCFDRWRMPGPMIVGRWCSIALTVRAAQANHPFDALTTHPALYERRFGIVATDMPPPPPLVIEDDVWIGHNAVILPGCRRIGRGSIIGAGAIVTRDVDRYAIVAGNPARKLRDRFDPAMQAAVEASRWWEMDLPELRDWIARDPELVYHPTAATLQAWTAARPMPGSPA